MIIDNCNFSISVHPLGIYQITFENENDEHFTIQRDFHFHELEEENASCYLESSYLEIIDHYKKFHLSTSYLQIL